MAGQEGAVGRGGGLATLAEDVAVAAELAVAGTAG